MMAVVWTVREEYKGEGGTRVFTSLKAAMGHVREIKELVDHDSLVDYSELPEWGSSRRRGQFDLSDVHSLNEIMLARVELEG